MIFQVTGLGMQREQMSQQKINDLVNNIYKMGMLEAYQPGTEQVFAKNVPGYGDLTLSQYKALPEKDRLYTSHVLSARERGEEPMPRAEFESISDKERHPASAEAAAIKGLYEEHKGQPPETELKRVHDLFRPEPTPETPSPVTWTAAANMIDKDFGHYDPVGRYVTTEEGQESRQKAYENFIALKESGMNDPLKAKHLAVKISKKFPYINLTTEHKRYVGYVEKAMQISDSGRREEKIREIRSKFYNKFGYLPSEER